MLRPIITTYAWVPPAARGAKRDLRARWACEEQGLEYEIRLIDWEQSKGHEYRRLQPFGQVPIYSDGEVEIFETGAIALRVAEIGTNLLPTSALKRMKVVQWVIASLSSIEPWITRMKAEQEIGESRQTSSAGGDRRGDGWLLRGTSR